ncbi:hypothetical protein BJY00DRAFT_278677 [Aspergillus carlsbadensis]|nr:hypothetical protein BJY00DRAFT_278677 [Aspergillus carlsbadensis]
MAEPSEPRTSTPAPAPAGETERSPKRIILRLRVQDFETSPPTDFNRAMIAYLESAGRSRDELSAGKCRSHIEPFQDPELRQRSFHIVLDRDKDEFDNPDLEAVEHEVYRVRRAKDGSDAITIRRISNPLEEKNFIRKMRHFTDRFFPWAD